MSLTQDGLLPAAFMVRAPPPASYHFLPSCPRLCPGPLALGVSSTSLMPLRSCCLRTRLCRVVVWEKERQGRVAEGGKLGLGGFGKSVRVGGAREGFSPRRRESAHGRREGGLSAPGERDLVWGEGGETTPDNLVYGYCSARLTLEKTQR